MAQPRAEMAHSHDTTISDVLKIFSNCMLEMQDAQEKRYRLMMTEVFQGVKEDLKAEFKKEMHSLILSTLSQHESSKGTASHQVPFGRISRGAIMDYNAGDEEHALDGLPLNPGSRLMLQSQAARKVGGGASSSVSLPQLATIMNTSVEKNVHTESPFRSTSDLTACTTDSFPIRRRGIVLQTTMEEEGVIHQQVERSDMADLIQTKNTLEHLGAVDQSVKASAPVLATSGMGHLAKNTTSSAKSFQDIIDVAQARQQRAIADSEQSKQAGGLEKQFSAVKSFSVRKALAVQRINSQEMKEVEVDDDECQDEHVSEFPQHGPSNPAKKPHELLKQGSNGIKSSHKKSPDGGIKSATNKGSGESGLSKSSESSTSVRQRKIVTTLAVPPSDAGYMLKTHDSAASYMSQSSDSRKSNQAVPRSGWFSSNKVAPAAAMCDELGTQDSEVSQFKGMVEKVRLALIPDSERKGGRDHSELQDGALIMTTQNASGKGGPMSVTIHRGDRDQLISEKRLILLRNNWTHRIQMTAKNESIWDAWDPSNTYRITADFLLLFLMIYVLVCTPYYIAFNIDTAELFTTAIAGIDLFVSCIFMIDVLLNFHYSYIDNQGHFERNHRLIAVRYIKCWFWVDMASSLPWDFILKNAAASSIRVLRLLRLFRLLQLFKVLRTLRRKNVKNLVNHIEEAVGKTNMRLMQLALMALCMLHWAGCMFYYAASWSNFDENTWVYHQDLVPNNVTGREIGVHYYVRYIYAIYWSTVTMTTVGYGDILPYNIAEKIIATAIILAGATMFAFSMGNMASIIAESDSTQAKLAHKRAEIDEFLKSREVPRELCEKVRAYSNYCMARTLQVEEAEIIAGLSVGLKMQMVMHLYREAVQTIPIFRGKPPQFITSLVTYLKLEYYAPGDIVVRQAEAGSEMYFVSSGYLEVRVYSKDFDKVNEDIMMQAAGTAANKYSGAVNKDPHQPKLAENRQQNAFISHPLILSADDIAHLGYTEIGNLSSGDSFGTYSCLLGEPRSATVVALMYSELYSLKRSDLEQVVGQWPEMADEFKVLATSSHVVEDAAWEVREDMGLRSRVQLNAGEDIEDDVDVEGAGSERSVKSSTDSSSCAVDNEEKNRVHAFKCADDAEVDATVHYVDPFSLHALGGKVFVNSSRLGDNAIALTPSSSQPLVVTPDSDCHLLRDAEAAFKAAKEEVVASARTQLDSAAAPSPSPDEEGVAVLAQHSIVATDVMPSAAAQVQLIDLAPGGTAPALLVTSPFESGMLTAPVAETVVNPLRITPGLKDPATLESSRCGETAS